MEKVKLSNKESRLLHWLEGHSTITSDQARSLLGDARVSQTVLQLRRKGYHIETVRVDITNRYGEPTWYGRYELK